MYGNTTDFCILPCYLATFRNFGGGLVTESCLTLAIPLDCSLPGSTVHRIFQARILEWVPISFSRGSSWPRDWTRVSCTSGIFFTDLSHEWKWTLFRHNNLLILLGFPDKWKWHLNVKNNFSSFLQFLVSLSHGNILVVLYYKPEKAMAPHSSTLAWKIPWMEEPGGLQSMGLLGVGHDWATSLSLFTFHFHALEKEMATHSSILAWRIPGTGEPGGLPSMGSHRVGHDWSDLAAAAMINGSGGSRFLCFLSELKEINLRAHCV